MDTSTSNYLTNAEQFTDQVRAVGDWTVPSPCDGWTAADVLAHVVTTQRDFLIDRGADLGEMPTGTPEEIWQTHHAAVTGLLQDQEWAQEEYEGYFGPTTVAQTLATFYGFDLIVHRWDVGRAAGQAVSWSEDEMDQVDAATAGFGDQLYMEGICKPALDPAPDADRQDRILAKLGRRA